jgi:hypothetical protein
MSDEPEVWDGEDSLEVSSEAPAQESTLEVPVVPESSQDGDEFIGLFFPENHSISVTLYAYILRLAGRPRIQGILGKQSNALIEAGLEEYEIRSSWSVPTASEMDGYREEAAEFRSQGQSMMVNQLLLRDIIIASHLKALLLPPDYKPFPLNYTRRNRLSTETMGRLKKLHSGIFDVFYTEFQSEACLLS